MDHEGVPVWLGLGVIGLSLVLFWVAVSWLLWTAHEALG